MKLSLTTIPLALVLLSASALAGTVADFESGFRNTYASYRTALFATNSGDADKSKRALSDFDNSWRDLVSKNGSAPPPQYEDDAAWGATLKDVSEAIDKARQLADSGNLPQSHDTLELVRDAIGDLHRRNGIVLFSDRMNAYHARMEHVIALSAGDAAEPQQLVEQSAVLAYLAEDMLQTPPVEAEGNGAFDDLAASLTASVAALQAAVRSGDAGAIKAAVSGLKMPYAKLFLKFG